MFDLFRSRAKAVRYLLGGLLLLVALSMVVTLIPGYGGFGAASAEDNVVAEVGKQPITVQDFQQQLQTITRRQQIPPELMGTLAPQFISQMISERVLLYEADKLGIEVTPAELARAIQATLPQLFQGGQFPGKEVYAAFLAQNNMTIDEFENGLRKQLVMAKLQNMIGAGVVVTPAEIEKAYKQKNEKVKLEYVVIPTSKYKADATVTPEEIQKQFQAHRSEYTIPEKWNLDMLVVSEAKVSQQITVPEAELRKYYDANKDQYRTPERVQVRHILLKTTDVPAAEVPKIQAKAEDILKQLKAGADFAALAKKDSQDPGSAVKGGDLGWVVRGQTVPAFESAAFSLPVNQLSGVVKTEYGFHILQVTAKEPAHLKTFDEVKDEIADSLKKQKVVDTVQALADKAHAELVKNPGQAAQIAQQLGIDLVKADKIGAGDAAPEFGNNPDFQDEIAGLKKGGVTPVMQAPGNKLAIATVTEVFPARPAELSEVENQIRDSLSAAKLNQIVQQKAFEASQKAKAYNGDMKRVAKEMGLEVKTTQDFTITGAADGIGSASMVAQAFQLPVGGVFGPVVVGENQFVCKVDTKTPADMTKLAEQRSQLRDEIKSQKAQMEFQFFEDSVRNALIRDGKVKIHQNVLQRIVNGYRS
jgi:peptidyl-prolyl cis-trans isomerase D